MHDIWYIHGANSTKDSFNYIQYCLPYHFPHHVQYNHQETVDDVISRTIKQVNGYPKSIIIGHSLGGVIATRVAQECDTVSKVVTLSSPLGGCQTANLFKWFSHDHLMSDISPSHPNYTKLLLKEPKAKILSFVSQNGKSVLGQATDGVVSVASQTALPYPKYVYKTINHFEVLLNSDIMTEIKSFIQTES